MLKIVVLDKRFFKLLFSAWYPGGWMVFPHIHDAVKQSFVHVPIMGFRKKILSIHFSIEVSDVIPGKYSSCVTLSFSMISPLLLILDWRDSPNGYISKFGISIS